MEKKNSILGGLILIIVGVFFLALQLFPGLSGRIDLSQHWPLIIVGIGGLFWAAALLGTPPLAIPGSIIGGLGLLLYYQNLSGNWSSWAYTWTLIPGFVGLGTLFNGLMTGQKHAWREGGRLIATSLVLFLIFGTFLGGWFSLRMLWPLLLIGLGFWILIRNLLRRHF